tara:strand:- start:131 stop:343 length:213 start_codon:yes stop_codon:yes gene_type:complete
MFTPHDVANVQATCDALTRKCTDSREVAERARQVCALRAECRALEKAAEEQAEAARRAASQREYAQRFVG